MTMPTHTTPGTLNCVAFLSRCSEFDKCDAICKNHGRKGDGDLLFSYKTNAIFIPSLI
jgi:hypothetical protein